jgi:hypothetical protein
MGCGSEEALQQAFASEWEREYETAAEAQAYESAQALGRGYGIWKQVAMALGCVIWWEL